MNPTQQRATAAKMLPSDIRTTLRRRAGCGSHDTPPVVIVRGRQTHSPPKQAGERYRKWTWHARRRDGTIAFSRTEYTPSTRRVEVGRAWLLRWLAASACWSDLADELQEALERVENERRTP